MIHVLTTFITFSSTVKLLLVLIQHKNKTMVLWYSTLCWCACPWLCTDKILRMHVFSISSMKQPKHVNKSYNPPWLTQGWYHSIEPGSQHVSSQSCTLKRSHINKKWNCFLCHPSCSRIKRIPEIYWIWKKCVNHILLMLPPKNPKLIYYAICEKQLSLVMHVFNIQKQNL